MLAIQDTPHNRQSQTLAFRAVFSTEPIKQVKNLLDLFAVDPDPVIGNGIFGHVVPQTAANLDDRLAVGVVILDRIVQQVDENLASRPSWYPYIR